MKIPFIDYFRDYVSTTADESNVVEGGGINVVIDDCDDDENADIRNVAIIAKANGFDNEDEDQVKIIVAALW